MYSVYPLVSLNNLGSLHARTHLHDSDRGRTADIRKYIKFNKTSGQSSVPHTLVFVCEDFHFPVEISDGGAAAREMIAPKR